VRLLVVGGTRFVGRHMVASALARGHEVTLLHRGTGDVDPFPEAEHLHVDRDGDLGVLAGTTYDATIDACAYTPGQVDHLADALGERAGRYVLVSSTAVYDTDRSHLYNEDASLAELADADTAELTGETYGGLKVACERRAAQRFARVLVLRPTYVVGPWDHTDRFGYWVRRLAAGGEVLAPAPYDAQIQVIDARDLAQFTVALCERGVTGTFHVVSPETPLNLGGMLEAIRVAVAPPGTSVTWVDAAWLEAHGISDRQLPLWTGGRIDEYENADPARAIAAGLLPRPLEVTVREVRAAQEAGDDITSSDRLSRVLEADLLSAWRRR
jgi:2'-hydroxyisoflavone reductase